MPCRQSRKGSGCLSSLVGMGMRDWEVSSSNRNSRQRRFLWFLMCRDKEMHTPRTRILTRTRRPTRILCPFQQPRRRPRSTNPTNNSLRKLGSHLLRLFPLLCLPPSPNRRTGMGIHRSTCRCRLIWMLLRRRCGCMIDFRHQGLFFSVSVFYSSAVCIVLNS